MRALVYALFAICCTATADTLEDLPLDTKPERPQPVRVQPEPYIPPVDVRTELARLNPQYVLQESLDLELIRQDGVRIDEYRAKARKQNPFYGLRMQEPLQPRHISLFVLMNLLDVYTTMEGSSYPCVVEINPLLPRKPSLEEVLLLKSLASWIQLDNNLDGKIDYNPQLIRETTFITSIAVMNNYDVIQRAMKTCPR